MDRFIQRLNIVHYERLLLSVTDESQRQRISMLLEEERAKKPTDKPTDTDNSRHIGRSATFVAAADRR